MVSGGESFLPEQGGRGTPEGGNSMCHMTGKRLTNYETSKPMVCLDS